MVWLGLHTKHDHTSIGNSIWHFMAEVNMNRGHQMSKPCPRCAYCKCWTSPGWCSMNILFIVLETPRPSCLSSSVNLFMIFYSGVLEQTLNSSHSHNPTYLVVLKNAAVLLYMITMCLKLDVQASADVDQTVIVMCELHLTTCLQWLLWRSSKMLMETSDFSSVFILRSRSPTTFAQLLYY